MPPDVMFRPLPVWPHPATPAAERRGPWTFKAGWGDTLDLLRREIGLLGGTDVVVGCGMRPEDIRKDGWPRSNARTPAHPGIEISFTGPSTNLRGERLLRRYGTVKRALAATHPDAGGDLEDFVAVRALQDTARLVYATDVCARWEHNVRSIALGLEALRAVGRFGITPSGNQYAGFRAALNT